MTLTETRTAASRQAPDRAAQRTAAGAAAVLAIALFMTVAVINVPHKPTNAELLTWWQNSGNRASGVASGIFALLVAVSLPIVVNYLAALRASAASPQWFGFARSMAAAVSAVWLVTGAARATVGHLVDTMDEPLPGVDVLRYSTGFNYTLLGLAGMGVLGLCMLAVSVVILRSRVLGRWVAYVGFGAAGITLVAVAAQYGAYVTPVAILWALCLAVAIWRTPASGPTEVR